MFFYHLGDLVDLARSMRELFTITTKVSIVFFTIVHHPTRTGSTVPRRNISPSGPPAIREIKTTKRKKKTSSIRRKNGENGQRTSPCSTLMMMDQRRARMTDDDDPIVGLHQQQVHIYIQGGPPFLPINASRCAAR